MPERRERVGIEKRRHPRLGDRALEVLDRVLVIAPVGGREAQTDPRPDGVAHVSVVHRVEKNFAQQLFGDGDVPVQPQDQLGLAELQRARLGIGQIPRLSRGSRRSRRASRASTRSAFIDGTRSPSSIREMYA